MNESAAAEQDPVPDCWQPWRDSRNEPSYLPAVAQTLAAVKNVSVETIAAHTTTNARRLFVV